MYMKRIPLLSFLFLFVFIFTTTVTLIVEEISASVCCTIQCQIGCTPPSINGIWYFDPLPHCIIPPNHADACWQECICS